jgi:hypothetical protein
MRKYSLIFVLLFLFTSGYAQEDPQREHDLFVMPTAFTLEKGQSYFTDYELFFLNFGYAITPKTHISVFTLFPITVDALETFSIGFKQNVLNTQSMGMAFFGSYTFDNRGYTAGGLASFILSPKASLHAGIGVTGDTELNGTEMLFLGGLKLELTQRTALIAEYTNFQTGIENSFKGLINIGVRFRSKRMMIDFAGLRPLESTGDLIFFPFLKATVIFGRK